MPYVYMDTGALRYVLQAFSQIELDIRLREKIILTPVTAIELLAQLVVENRQEILEQIQSLRHILNGAKAEILPWPDVAIAKMVFGEVLDDEGFDERLKRAINSCLGAEDASVFRDDAVALRALLDTAKDAAVAQLRRVIASIRQAAPLTKEANQQMFADSIANRVNLKPDSKPVDEVITLLDAYYVYECEKIRVAAETLDYNPQNHRNDLLDANQLVYLADSRLRFLTTDKGFRKASASPQFDRIYLVPETLLRNPGEIMQLLATITETSL